MHLLFIDESGTIPSKSKISENFFVLGGVIIPEDLWGALDQELTLLKTQLKIDGEIKWRYFAPQKGNNRNHPLSHLNAHQKEGLRLGLYNLINKHISIQVICVVVDIQAAYSLANVESEKDLYWFAYRRLIDNFAVHLNDLSGAVGHKINGIIICDHRQPKDDHYLRILHQKLLTESKRHVQMYANLIQGVFLAPSHLSLGIQLADMLAGAAYRKFIKNDPRYFDLIQRPLRKSQKGNIDGYGLIRVPDEKGAPCRETPEPASIDAVTA